MFILRLFPLFLIIFSGLCGQARQALLQLLHAPASESATDLNIDYSDYGSPGRPTPRQVRYRHGWSTCLCSSANSSMLRHSGLAVGSEASYIPCSAGAICSAAVPHTSRVGASLGPGGAPSKWRFQ